MPTTPINNPNHWLERAAVMHALAALAATMNNDTCAVMPLRLADDYDRLADRAAPACWR
jgi:hypothetical protein